MRRSKTSHLLENWLSLRFRLFLEGIIIGVLTGTVIVFYRVMLVHAETLRGNVYYIMQNRSWWIIPIWFFALICLGYLLGRACKKEPLLGGSGIPQVKGIIWGRIKSNWVTVLIGKFIGSLLAVGGGLSLGRGAPSIQMGAAIAQGVSRNLGRLRIEEKYLITCGTSAGLAAAFNAPLAGVIFAIEEMHKNLSPLLLTSALAASLSADLVSRHFFGQKPVFYFADLPVLPLSHYPYLLILGLLMGLFGVYFNYCLQKSLNFYQNSGLPIEFRPILPLIAAGIIGFFLPQVLGGGDTLINELSTLNIALSTLVILVIFKFFFTMFSYGSGVPGGIFLPLLVIGALSGSIFGGLIIKYLNVNPQYLHNFIIYAMAAYLTAIIKAPITGSILLTEMTGSFNHLLATLVVSMSAYLVSDLLKSRPIYEVLLERLMKKDGWSEYKPDAHDNKVIMEIPVCLNSELDRKRVKDISWPKGCLLVSLKRGESEIIPKGDTLIHVGDHLVVLTSENSETSDSNLLTHLAGECLDKK
ncbi:MAG: ClC family H(+)/Cl(-) exchange transporter [Firmicutes bacterium HGW-Firmicutes-12]|jgi:H+/Cl- antiporter ClcA|nr:MAG: ClC family H(+)/Cl(-) exchange transporter [Firmicutes bacterium HGW-Firmicutes-12]